MDVSHVLCTGVLMFLFKAIYSLVIWLIISKVGNLIFEKIFILVFKF